MRGRLGYAIDRWMPYVTGGLAYGDIKASPAGFPGDSATNVGWTVGAGAEFSRPTGRDPTKQAMAETEADRARDEPRELHYLELDPLSRVLGRQHHLPAALARHFEKAEPELQARLPPQAGERLKRRPNNETDPILLRRPPLKSSISLEWQAFSKRFSVS